MEEDAKLHVHQIIEDFGEEFGNGSVEKADLTRGDALIQPAASEDHKVLPKERSKFASPIVRYE